MSLVFWLVVLGGPAVCAAAGAWVEYLLMIRQVDRKIEAAYAEGWDDSEARVALHYGSMSWLAEKAIDPVTQQALAAAVAGAHTLPALPAVHREGARHARPQQAAQRDGGDILILGVRNRFDQIRMGLGLRLPPDPRSGDHQAGAAAAPGTDTGVIP